MFTVLVFDLMCDEELYNTENYNQEFPPKKQPQALGKEACEREGTKEYRMHVNTYICISQA